jgi:hypothetical protein
LKTNFVIWKGEYYVKFKFKETTKIRLEKSITETKEILKPSEILIFDSFVEKNKGYFIMNGLLKVNRNEWPNKEIIEKIKMLPPNIDIIVDADSAL